MTRHHARTDAPPAVIGRATNATSRTTTTIRAAGIGATIAAVLAAGTVFAAPAAAAPGPDFGPNVIIFDPSDSVEHINQTLVSISNEAEFSPNRHAVFFKPGTYGSAAGQNNPETATGIVNAELGYYTSVAGLGASPEDVRLNGAIHVEPVRQCEDTPWACQQPGSLTRFWRSLSNVTINPIQQPVGADALRPIPNGVAPAHTLRFAVSQAAPLRRVNIEGDLSVFGRFGEYASGGYLANSRVSGTVSTGSQQQWFTRDSEVGSWDGGVWNTVFSGVDGAPATDFAPGNKTTIDETPVTRESPYLYLDGDDYKVFVPSAKTNTSGVNWGTSTSDGAAIDIADFYIAHEGDSAATINQALASGKNLLLTPGVYRLAESIKVTRADTVVLGLGYASLTPTAGTSALEVADVPGVVVSGITVDAGTTESATLVKIGSAAGAAGDASNPTTLSDVFIRIGGAWAGKAKTSIEINSDDVLLDHIWAWRADHGDAGAFGWDVNTGAHGVVVNGDDVTATGLFVEHYQENQTVWNGERGRTIFYQSELPYDPPSQDAWNDGTRNGYASYRVADDVRVHNATGLGNYSFFERGIPILAESGIQAPKSRQVTFTSMTSVFLNGSGGISHIINDAGAGAVGTFGSPQLASYPPTDTTAPTVTITPNTTAVDGWHPATSLTITATDDFTPPPAVEANVDGAGWVAVTGPIVLTEGEHTVLARATDDSDNVSDDVTWTGRVDITAPVVTATVDDTAGTVALAATDTGSGVATLEYALGSAVATGASTWTAYSTPVAVTPGARVVSFRATDAVGNVSQIGSSRVAATTAPSISFGGGTLTPGQQVSLTGSGIPAGAYTVVFRSEPVTVASTSVDGAGTLAVTFRVPTDATAGAHRIELTAADGTVIASADATVVAAAGAGTGSGLLSSTGFGTGGPFLVASLLLLLAGGALLIARRRAAAAKLHADGSVTE
ncbi:OmpL47-type beta-barrel domain-containing protein [Plantibacter sp. Mn2098]|uniref:OmpL47-type beta-barrel domain-containing protein n=1 Tax=Plantibacter sp. Mn2098 TaxID=3395266 RepID=UPI003BD4A9C1